MPFVIIGLVIGFWVLYMIRNSNKGQVVRLEAPVTWKTDPVAHHPMHCKCTFHR
jgi:hypothetical protein